MAEDNLVIFESYFLSRAGQIILKDFNVFTMEKKAANILFCLWMTHRNVQSTKKVLFLISAEI